MRGRGGADERSARPGPAAWILCVPLLGFLHACAPASPIDPTADLVVYGARVWDGTGAALNEPAVLQVAAGRIMSVAPLAEGIDVAAAAAEAGVTAVDATGQYIVPGLINVHGHVGGTWNPGTGVEYGDYAAAELARYARFGVTTVNSLGGDREASFALRDASWGEDTGAEDGAYAGADADMDTSGSARARLLVAGPVVTGSSPGGSRHGGRCGSPRWARTGSRSAWTTIWARHTKMSRETFAAVIVSRPRTRPPRGLAPLLPGGRQGTAARRDGPCRAQHPRRGGRRRDDRASSARPASATCRRSPARCRPSPTGTARTSSTTRS